MAVHEIEVLARTRKIIGHCWGAGSAMMYRYLRGIPLNAGEEPKGQDDEPTPSGGRVTTDTDITEQKKLAEEAALEASVLRATFDTMSNGCSVYDSEMKLIRYNARFDELFEFPPGFLHPGISAKDIIKFRAYRGDYGPGNIDEIINRRIERVKNIRDDQSDEHLLPMGKTYIHNRKPMPNGGWVSTYTDVTKQKKLAAEAALDASVLQATFDTMSHGCAVYDSEMNLIRYNARFDELFEFPPGFLHLGISAKGIIKFRADRGDYGPGDLDEIVNRRFERVKSFTASIRSGEHILPNGIHYVHHRKPMPGGGCLFTYTDISKHKQLEAKLRQAQKMEAIGQLTGGVAHDFNNLLSVVLINLQMAAERLQGKSDIYKLVEAATNATVRGAELTKRLLSFSRQQILQPEAIKIDSVVAGMTELLRRTIGESIDLTLHSSEDLWSTMIDPAQLESAILNLALNARDAMPDGGSLTIEISNVELDEGDISLTADVTPGRYVLVRITDTGIGMTRQTLDSAFEPFFTTKGVGVGTGLGLSMVYGFLKQSNGHVTLSSEEGRGTTVKLYFPFWDGIMPDKVALSETNTTIPRGDECILIVEDDEDVRNSLVTFLGGLGYRILEADNGDIALDVLDREAPIDLILSDIVMPGNLDGMALANFANEQYPEIRVFLMTGYTDFRQTEDTELPNIVDIIIKPFDILVLAQKIHDALKTASSDPRR